MSVRDDGTNLCVGDGIFLTFRSAIDVDNFSQVNDTDDINSDAINF